MRLFYQADQSWRVVRETGDLYFAAVRAQLGECKRVIGEDLRQTFQNYDVPGGFLPLFALEKCDGVVGGSRLPIAYCGSAFGEAARERSLFRNPSFRPR